MAACVFPVSKTPTVEQSRKNQVGGKGKGSSLRVHQVPSVRDDFLPRWALWGGVSKSQEKVFVGKQCQAVDIQEEEGQWVGFAHTGQSFVNTPTCAHCQHPHSGVLYHLSEPHHGRRGIFGIAMGPRLCLHQQ